MNWPGSNGMDQSFRTYIRMVAWTTYAQTLALDPNDPLVSMDGSSLRDIVTAVIAHAEEQNTAEKQAALQQVAPQLMVAEEESVVKLEDLWEERSGSKSAISSEKRVSSGQVRGTYRNYSVELKKSIVLQIEQELKKSGGLNESKIIRQVAKRQQIHAKNIARWFKAKEFKTHGRQRKCQFPKMQAILIDFVIENRKQGIILKRCKVIQKAKAIMRELYPDAISVFQYSKGWYERFRARLNRRLSQTQQQPNAQQQNNSGNLSSIDNNVSVPAQLNITVQPTEAEVKLEEIEQANP